MKADRYRKLSLDYAEGKRPSPRGERQKRILRLNAFGDFLLDRHHVGALADLPAGPRDDYRRLACRLGIEPAGLERSQ